MPGIVSLPEREIPTKKNDVEERVQSGCSQRVVQHSGYLTFSESWK